jgi:small conductance mechanosensitive channel
MRRLSQCAVFRRNVVTKGLPRSGVLVVPFLAAVAVGADAPSPPKPLTTGNPVVAVEELRILLIPLTKDELAVEVDGWIGLVRAKAMEIGTAEIGLRALWKKAEAATAAGTSGDDAAGDADRQKLMDELVRLREHRTELIDRARVVLSAFADKGGKPADQELYLTAVSGLNLDVKDTGAAWATVKGWALSAQGGLRWVKNIAFFLLTLVVFRILASIAGSATRRLVAASRSGSELLRDFMANSARKATMLIGLVVALSMLEVNIGPFVAAIGAVGFVVGFAMQGTLGNLAAGIMILLYRPYDLGNTVTIAGNTGKVESMSLVSTTIRTAENKSVVVPNSAIWGSAIQLHPSQ